MKLQTTCPCGARFLFECDDKSIDTLQNGKLLYEQWKKEHKDHTASIVKEFFQKY